MFEIVTDIDYFHGFRAVTTLKNSLSNKLALTNIKTLPSICIGVRVFEGKRIYK